jgi:ATP-dependent 26S proteasome regulatory subunit
MPLSPEVSLEKISEMSDGLSGAETALICREAGLMALTEGGIIERLDSKEEQDKFCVSLHCVEQALKGV